MGMVESFPRAGHLTQSQKSRIEIEVRASFQEIIVKYEESVSDQPPFERAWLIDIFKEEFLCKIRKACIHEAGHVTVAMALGYHRGYFADAHINVTWLEDDYKRDPKVETFKPPGADFDDLEKAAIGSGGLIAEWSFSESHQRLTDFCVETFAQRLEDSVKYQGASETDIASINKANGDLVSAVSLARQALMENEAFFQWTVLQLWAHDELPVSLSIAAWQANMQDIRPPPGTAPETWEGFDFKMPDLTAYGTPDDAD